MAWQKMQAEQLPQPLKGRIWRLVQEVYRLRKRPLIGAYLGDYWCMVQVSYIREEPPAVYLNIAEGDPSSPGASMVRLRPFLVYRYLAYICRTPDAI